MRRNVKQREIEILRQDIDGQWVVLPDCWAFRKATFQCMELVHCVEKRKMKRQTMNIRFVDSDEL